MKTQWFLIAAVIVGFCCAGTTCLVVVGALGNNEAMDDGVVTKPAAATSDSELVGEWSSTSTSLTQYRNMATGAWAPPSGNSMSVELRDDGSCVKAGLMQNTMYGCTSYIFVFIEDCTWSQSGSTVTLEVGEGETRSKGCGGEEKRGKTVRGPHVFQLVTDEAKPTLQDGTLTLRRMR